MSSKYVHTSKMNFPSRKYHSNIPNRPLTVSYICIQVKDTTTVHVVDAVTKYASNNTYVVKLGFSDPR